MVSSWSVVGHALLLGALALKGVTAAECTTATVGSPYDDCYDIWTAAGITEAQFDSYNPGIDCSDLQPGQVVCVSPGSLPTGPTAYPNGTCYMYTTVSGDTCGAIAAKFYITVDDIEDWNEDTYKWTGCDDLQVGFTLCVSTGTPPPITIDPNLQCGPQSPGNATCPLNACCSAFGYCGLTDDFCSTTGANPCISNCGQPTLPSCSGAPANARKIGYYEGWAPQRPCGPVNPGDIDWSGYTHAHYAFATISQTFEVLLADTDIPLLQELVSLKSVYSGLNVILAVGGWTFSEADPTRDLFSLMIATNSSRATFISSVQSTLSQYNLDGLDIDFEYPGAVERDAPATDTPDLTAFFQEMRAQLPSTILSIATPAGYWFLQGFQINKIAQYVTYMNMMSYDYHGPWDTNVTDQAPVTNPHTSILDIESSASLYVRAEIDLSIVNLGLAWYGRTYHLEDASCSGYNCTMVGGGAPGPCTNASGVLAQFEILNLIDEGNTPTFDLTSETYWFDDSNGDLVTFDQADTWQVKETFAFDTCFGGTFVWSMDQIIPGSDGTGTGPGGGSGSGSGSGSGEYTVIPWNPNAAPSSGAVSETFAAAGSTTVFAVPTAETSITVGGVVITLASGGQPIQSLVPTSVSQPNAVVPTWTYEIVPPAAATVTFTAPLTGVATFSTAVPAPASGAQAQTISGANDPSCETWTLTYGPSIVGCLPSVVGIPGGTTPTAVPPDDWTGIWTNPVPPYSVSTVGASASHSYSYVTWNPNPYPPPTATAETIVGSGSTTILAVPTSTTSLTIGGVIITLGPGGTPINSPIPPDFTILGGITPTWTYWIEPTSGASQVTFTAPLTSSPTWSSVVPVPKSTGAPPAIVTGPPGSQDSCDSSTNIFSVLFGGILGGCPPSIVGIVDGITPLALRPPGWTGPWTNPDPLPTGDPDDESTSTTSTTSSTTSSSSSSGCSPTANIGEVYDQYILPDDAANEDWEDEGTDPDYRKREVDVIVLTSRVSDDPRYIAVNNCNLKQSSPSFVQLGPGNYYTLSDVITYTGVGLSVSGVPGRPTDGPPTVQEHVFELGYINQFLTNSPINAITAGCSWISDNIFNYQLTNGQTLGLALVQAIDNLDNLVWADTPMNQAKSNVVNDNAGGASNPPQQTNMNNIATDQPVNLTPLEDAIQMEYFLRSLGGLGNYFAMTSGNFYGTALKVQNLLSEITPPSNAIPDNSKSIPMIFNEWLSSLLSAYPSGCTSRAQNAMTYYATTIQTALAAGYIQQNDLCNLPLYQNRAFFAPSSFVYQNLIPAYPASSQCHTPGNQGYPGYRDPNGNHYVLWDANVIYTVLGSGSTDNYAVGSGTTLTGSHMQAEPISTATFPNCGGVYNIMDENPSGTAVALGVGFGCTSQTDPNEPGAVFDTMNYYINGQSLACQVLFDDEDEQSATTAFICGPNANAVASCATSVASSDSVGTSAFPVSPIWYTSLS